MKKLLFRTALLLVTAAASTSTYAKDRQEYVIHVDSDGARYYVDRDGKRHWIKDDHRHEADYRDHDYRGYDQRDYRGYNRDRSRTIYIIENNRPVERVVYIDSEGRYYRRIEGERVYVRGRYYESYPSKLYYPDGRRRVTISLPF